MGNDTLERVTLTGSELKVMLGGLGLPPSWFAKRMGVAMRTVVRWFDEDGPISPRAEDELERINTETLREMRKMVAKADRVKGTVVLRTYRTDGDIDGWPATWHRALTFRVLEHLRAQGRTVRVEYA